MSQPADIPPLQAFTEQSPRGTKCLYYQRDDGIHVIIFLSSDADVYPSFGSHMLHIGQNFPIGISRVLMNAVETSGLNLSLLFAEIKKNDTLLPHRAPGRVAVLSKVSLVLPMMNLLLTAVTRNSDKMRIFDNEGQAIAWLHRE